MLRNKRERFHVYFLVIRIQSTRPTSLPAPTGFYVGQTEVTPSRRPEKPINCKDVTNKMSQKLPPGPCLCFPVIDPTLKSSVSVRSLVL